MNDVNPDPSIETQPEPSYIARAGDLLEAVLLGDLDTGARLAVGTALSVLYDVHPPYPPRTSPTRTVGLTTGVTQALNELSQGPGAPTSVEEAIRAGRAARELHRLRDRR